MQHRYYTTYLYDCSYSFVLYVVITILILIVYVTFICHPFDSYYYCDLVMDYYVYRVAGHTFSPSYSFTKRSLKGSYSMSKDGAKAFAPVGSPSPK